MVFAINKIDRPNANPDHIKEQLSQMNYLVESWGGKYQDQEVSAKKGLNHVILVHLTMIILSMWQRLVFLRKCLIRQARSGKMYLDMRHIS